MSYEASKNATQPRDELYELSSLKIVSWFLVAVIVKRIARHKSLRLTTEREKSLVNDAEKMFRNCQIRVDIIPANSRTNKEFRNYNTNIESFWIQYYDRLSEDQSE